MTQLIKNGETTVGAQLDPGPTGTILFPEDPGWDEARTPWVVNVDQQPAAVAVVRSVADVSAVVTSAARSGLKLIAQGTTSKRPLVWASAAAVSPSATASGRRPASAAWARSTATSGSPDPPLASSRFSNCAASEYKPAPYAARAVAPTRRRASRPIRLCKASTPLR